MQKKNPLQKKSAYKQRLINEYVMGRALGDAARLFSVLCSDRSRGNRQKMKYKKFYLNIRKSLFTYLLV